MLALRENILTTDRRGTATLLASFAGSSGLALAIRGAAVLFVTVLTVVAAQVSIPLPFTPVPLTFQPLVVLIAGAALGSRLGALSQLLYLAAGVAGLPVFAASPLLPQGVARLLGPTGGYLLSYPIAAFVAGSLAERGFDRRYFTSLIAMTAGLLVIFAGGILWLVHNPIVTISYRDALRIGAYPFLAADALKLLIGAGCLPALWSLFGLKRP